MNERLKAVRKALKLTQKEFATKLGMTDSGISKIEKGRAQLTEQLIRSICREFNINYNYLAFGEGEMFSDLPETVIDELCQEYDLDDLDRILIQEYVRMDAASRNVLKEYVRRIVQRTSAANDVQARIDAEVESYRRELEIEASRKEGSSASEGSDAKMA